MEKELKSNLLSIITEAINMISKTSSAGLAELSNRAVELAGVYQEEDVASITVIIHALSKIMQRSECDVEKGVCDINPEYRKIVAELEKIKSYIESDDRQKSKRSISSILDILQKADSKLKLYIEEVIFDSQIKKGGKLYDKGISLAQSAQILGINHWELMNYVGKTEIISIDDEAVGIRERLRFARGLF